MDQQSAIFLGGLMSLAGVAVGSILSFGVELFRRKWSLSDRKYSRRSELLDNRCQQAEEYVQSMTRDYRQLLRDIGLYLEKPDPQFVQARVQAREDWLDRWDTTIFSLGPAIRSIDHEGVKKAWNSLIDNMEQLQQIYRRVYDAAAGGGGPVDGPATMDLTKQLWLAYSEELSNFYSALDEARFSLTDQ